MKIPEEELTRIYRLSEEIRELLRQLEDQIDEIDDLHQKTED